MGTAQSVMSVRDSETGKTKLVSCGPTFSQKQNAKFLGKPVDKLSKEELTTDISDLKKQGKKK